MKDSVHTEKKGMTAFGGLIIGFSAHYAYEERDQSHEVGTTQSSQLDSTQGKTVLGRGKEVQEKKQSETQK